MDGSSLIVPTPTMQTLVPALFLLAVLALFSPALQLVLRERLRRRAPLVFAAPALLSLCFIAVARYFGATDFNLALLVLGYTFVPAVCAFPLRFRKPTRLDFAVILMLWLPLEFLPGKQWVPKPAQGVLHTTAYGIAILLALWIFLLFRGLPGMKYRLPQRATDLLWPLIGYVALAPVLIPLALHFSFMGPYHVPQRLSPGFVLARFLLILMATALPEEILFRALIQNWLMQKLGQGLPVLVLAGLIFGCAHLNNGPGPLPNWRYMALATIAGIGYGKVFQKASSVWSSALLHALINTTRHVFF